MDLSVVASSATIGKSISGSSASKQIFRGRAKKPMERSLSLLLSELLVVPGLTAAYTDKLEWFGTVRGRVGYAQDHWLAYVTGGWAFGHGSVSGTGTATPAGTVTAFSASQDYSGWTLGGGLEWAFMDRWSVKAEYLYIDFGNGPTMAANAAGTLNLVSNKMTDNIARLGVNYRF